MQRQAEVRRKTKETDIAIKLNLDGSGQVDISTDVPFMDHMLNLFAVHGCFDLKIAARGDTQIDDHHTVEDLGIALGAAISQALGEKRGIQRYGQALVPMDETLVRAVVDISGRPFLAYRADSPVRHAGRFDLGLLKEFFRALSVHAGLNLHLDLLAGDEPHHIAEALFKACGRALDQATGIDPRLEGEIRSTKGLL